MSDILTKRCKHCGKEYPATPEYFHRSRKHKFGIAHICKTCASIMHGYTPLKRPIAAPSGMKQCLQCEEVKSLNDFGADSRHPDGKRSSCKECKRKIDKIYRATHADTIKAKRQQYQARYKGRYKKRYARRYTEKNRISQRQWRRNNRVHVRIYYQRRVARAAALPSTFTLVDWEQCLIYWQYRCAVCGRTQGLWHKLAQDHWIPVTKGGGYVPSNIVPLCHGEGGCNNSKNNRDADEWLIDKFGPRKAKQILERIQDYLEWVAKQDRDHD